MLPFTLALLLLLLVHTFYWWSGLGEFVLEPLSIVSQCFNEATVPRVHSRGIGTNPTFSHQNISPVVMFESVIDEIDAAHLLALADCVKQNVPTHVEYRNFDQNEAKYGGGNNVTYIGGFVNEIIPEFVHYITSVAGFATDIAHWRPHPLHLGIRCVELLEYSTGGELLMHIDQASIYTMVLMLGNPGNFEGGKFVILPRVGLYDTEHPIKTVMKVEPQQYGGVLFDSLAPHSVEPITQGQRLVLAIEFWPFESIDIHDLRPQADGFMKGLKLTTSLLATGPLDEEDEEEGVTIFFYLEIIHRVFESTRTHLPLLYLVFGVCLGLLGGILLFPPLPPPVAPFPPCEGVPSRLPMPALSSSSLSHSSSAQLASSLPPSLSTYSALLTPQAPSSSMADSAEASSSESSTISAPAHGEKNNKKNN